MDKQKFYCNDIACEKSCWQEASERLRAEHPRLYAQLEEMLATQSQPLSSADVSGQIAKSIVASKNRLLERDLPFPWKHRDESEKAKVRKAMDSILKAVTVFKDMGTAAASLDPCHVGIAWIGVNLILQLVLSGTEQNAAALQGLAQISPIITRYAKVEEIYIEQRRKHQDTNLNKDFRTQVVSLYTNILVYQGAIISHSKRHPIVQFARAVPKVDDWSQLLLDIVRLDAECRKFTQIFDFEEQMARHYELKDILEQQDQQMEKVSRQFGHVHEQNQVLINYADQHENMEILDWVSTAFPDNDHTRTLEKGKLNREYANSGKWLFCRPEFQLWSNADDDSLSVLWLRGPVGTGKSSLVCLIIEQYLKQSLSICKEAGRLAFFYCSRKQGTEEANCSKTVLRSLLRQLAWSTNDLSVATIVKERYRQWQQGRGYGGRELLADDCITLLTQLIASYHHTTIIIDALDECSDFYELLSNLEEIMSAGQGKVKFLLSSRMNVPVQQIFPESARVEVGLDSKEDIEFFINTKMKQNKRRLAQCKALDLEDQMIETLSRRAQGMFRWVELQLDTFFSSKSNIKRRDIFKKKLEKLDKEFGIPELEEVYDEIYDMNTPEPEDRSVAERALKWIMCCRRPLSIEILVKAVSLDSNGDVDEEVDADYILDICSNFIVIDHNQLVQFAHLSVREHLMNGIKYGFTTTDANTQAARTSLLYLLAGGAQSDAHAGKRDGLLEYAALYWPLHCSLASVDHGKGNPLQDLLNNFLAPGEPSSGFITCLEIWPNALQKFDARELKSRIPASLSPTKSPVFTACAWGFYAVVQMALSRGFSPDDRNSRGNTALAVAAEFNNIEIVRLLLESGADANAVGSQDGYTPLHHGYKSLELVELLSHHGADVTKAVEGPINAGWTPLHLATCGQLEEIVRFLLAKGANVNAKDGWGSTALHIIAMIGNTAIARLLLEHGAEPSLENSNGETALREAATHGSEEMVKLLLKYQGLESDAEKWIRQAQFYNAVCEGEEETVQLLLEKGIDMTVKNARGEYPLHWATDRGHPRVASLLLQKGADIDAKDEFDETALLLACRKRNEEMVHFLLDKGADIDARKGQGGNGCTALSWAAAQGEPQLVEILLKRGADPQSVEVNSLERGRYVSPEDFEKALDIVRSHSLDLGRIAL